MIFRSPVKLYEFYCVVCRQKLTIISYRDIVDFSKLINRYCGIEVFNNMVAGLPIPCCANTNNLIFLKAVGIEHKENDDSNEYGLPYWRTNLDKLDRSMQKLELSKQAMFDRMFSNLPSKSNIDYGSEEPIPCCVESEEE